MLDYTAVAVNPEDDRYKSFIGKEVILGIRPEDIHDPETMSRGVEAVEIEARVEVVEPMGNEVFLYLTTGKSSFGARVSRGAKKT